MLSEAESQMEASLVGLEIQNSLKAKIEQTKDSIESKSCGLCGSLLNEEMRARLSIDLASMLGKLSTAERFGDSTAKSQARIRKLRRYASAPTLNHFAELERNALKAKLDVHRIDRQIADVKVRIRGYDRSEITRVESEYDSVVARIAKLNDDIAARERECRDQQATLARLQLEIARLPDADPSIAAEVAVCSALRETFRKAIDEFRDRLREDVEEQATEIFRVLTTEKQYEGLRINEQFGLSIVDDENRVVRDRSAGAEQIVALSLIGALNRCATREGPIVMDTPFGRLDVGHRANVLGFVPKMGPQVVLLVQSGEFSRSADLKYLEGKVSQEYKIMRHGKATRSRFEPVE
jgi:DNA sulfur modification protein DndD